MGSDRQTDRDGQRQRQTEPDRQIDRNNRYKEESYPTMIMASKAVSPFSLGLKRNKNICDKQINEHYES